MLTWLKTKLLGKPAKSKEQPSRRGFQARFDAAGHDDDTRNHWKQADGLSPDGAVSADVRRIIRERARYEVANNSVAFGVVTTRSFDLIGSGPRLQLSLPDPETGELTGVTSTEREDEQEAATERYEEAARFIEKEWEKWCAATGFADTLRVMERAKLVDGESFALAISNPKVNHPVKLQFRPFEADRVCDPLWVPTPGDSDGVTYDAAGNPESYRVLRYHPGDDTLGVNDPLAYDVHPAESVYHFFRADRPGQTRGVSWLTPALNLFAINRRYGLAVLGAAETAANIVAVLKQDPSLAVNLDDPNATAAGPMTPFVEFDLPRRGVMAAPPGGDITQLRAEQPVTQFGDFRREILNEIGRCLDMPLNVVQGNSSRYNYSSGRLDHIPYQRKLWVEREQLGNDHVSRMFRAWLDELVLLGLIPDGLPPIDRWEWCWDWDGFDTSADPLKDASAIEKLLALNLTDLAEQCAARGRRWQDVLRQRKREQDFADKIGLRPAVPTAPAPAPAANTDPEETTDEQ